MGNAGFAAMAIQSIDKMAYSTNVWNILACPQCGHHLEEADSAAICRQCGQVFNRTSSGIVDLRLRRPRTYSLDFELTSSLPVESEFMLQPLTRNPAAEVDFSAMVPPHHLTAELMSYFPKARRENSLALDLGCGNAIHQAVCERAGFEYVGLDYDTPGAMMWGDAHALPFKNDSFDFILSVAVLEHIRFPFVMMREAYRVLKPNQPFIGTVAFLEPFHANSFYHHTHLALLNCLHYGGFKVKQIAPSKEWTVLVAQLKSLFPKMPRPIARVLLAPALALHRMWWRFLRLRYSQFSENVRLRNTTGAFSFIAFKA